MSLLSNDITPNILFKYILKHYYLLLLKREWCIISSSIKNFSDLEKSNSYQQEIRKLEKELSSFTFFNKRHFAIMNEKKQVKRCNKKQIWNSAFLENQKTLNLKI